MKNLIIVGQAPSRLSDPRRPLSGKSGAKLAELAGVSHRFLLRSVDLENLMTRYAGKSGKGDAFRVSASRVLSVKRRMLRHHAAIVLGKSAAKRLGLEGNFLRWVECGSCRVAVIPHPSGINTWYNNPENVRRIKEFFRELAPFKKPNGASRSG